MAPRLSCIVSTYHRPLQLQLMLLSLRLQTEPNLEILVTDNSIDEEMRGHNDDACGLDSRIFYMRCGGTSCYRSGNIVARFAKGSIFAFHQTMDTMYLGSRH